MDILAHEILNRRVRAIINEMYVTVELAEETSSFINLFAFELMQ